MELDKIQSQIPPSSSRLIFGLTYAKSDSEVGFTCFLICVDLKM